ncbi:adenine deaminase [Desulfobotulus alkaliphilus]|uniref:Adenine deaminase n=1 Tax=Desulfobotulus alkaliphilus TaxID=622671 RepID=A0A562S630_9BACT|nr:adenine deaminase [Desulfobotulus alkaliphilus]TWI76811.1 adenine deaminase [Desulfobotulus alkaliphilus]
MEKYQEWMRVARGEAPADLLITGARIINVYTGEILETSLAVHQGRFVGFGDYEAINTLELAGRHIAPGFIDAHVHLESSMASPSEFVKAVLPRGTTSVAADPHEIANVLGTEGIQYMLKASENQPMDLLFTLPSCVPATHMETAGARLEAADLAPFLYHPRILALAEMMNYPGVIFGDKGVLEKIREAHRRAKPVDGHAPGLSGKALNAYLSAGISSDHECTTAEEAMEKMRGGMHIMVREGTCAQNLDALLPALNEQTSRRMMWCTDDRHPHDLIHEGHMDDIIRRAIAEGIDPVMAIQMATLNPAEYFSLKDRGAIAPGKRADFVVIGDLEALHIEAVYVKGKRVAERGRLLADLLLPETPAPPESMKIKPEQLDFSLKAEGESIRVIDVVPGQVVTGSLVMAAAMEQGMAVADAARDLVKLAVVERYTGKAGCGIAFVRGLGIRDGALASTVGHDSHNLIVAGDSDEDMKTAAAAVIEMKGGMAVVSRGRVMASLPLAIAGLMSTAPMETIEEQMNALIREAKVLGCPLADPFMTLGFLSLPVIPSLKLTDRGLVDVDRFELVSVFTDTP